MNWPDLPVSMTAISIAINMATMALLAPAVFRPLWRGHYHLWITLMFIFNALLTISNLWVWLHAAK